MSAAETAVDEPALAVEGLYRAYGESWALRELGFGLDRGRTLSVVGANGAGKSTLLRILAGLLRPSEGAVRVLGSSLPDETWRLRGRVGYLGHEALLYRELSAAENLRFHARLFGLPGQGAGRIAELLAAVGLEHRADSRVGEMSAGMVQRLAICRAVLHEPELLLLDEPVAHLDPDAAATVAPLIGAREGRTRVIVTHDLASARAGADRVLALGRDGRLAYEGPASAFDERAADAVFSERARPAAAALDPEPSS
ncbi:MAG TPA: ABC transporter ATP-binding protein [Solirubrobacterales bacterium]|nr:ABC transporter ATP-binding protein [Solirubrobacterales bacterium]